MVFYTSTYSVGECQYWSILFNRSISVKKRLELVLIFFFFIDFRRKDYQFYWQMDKQICPYIQATNFKSVKHVYIHSKRATNNSVHYFPNATELTIKEGFDTFGQSISTTLIRIVPLKQLTKLM